MNNSIPSEKTGPSLMLGAGFVLLVGYVLWTRLYDLGRMPVHHDESLFALYGYGITQGKGYEFYPMLHGPLLEWTLALIFTLVGDSDATMRLFPAVCGIGIFGTLLAMRRELGRSAIFWSAAFIAFSPTVTFVSRFCRNDIPFLFVAMSTVALALGYARNRKPICLFLIPVTLALATTIKETYVVFFGQILTFSVFTVLAERVFRPARRQEQQTQPEDADVPKTPFLRPFVVAFTRHPWVIGLGLTVGIFINVALYSSMFQKTENLNGLLQALQYWIGENGKRRIGGSYHFYLLLLALYELPLLLFWTGCLAARLRRGITPGPPTALSKTFALLWFLASAAVLPFIWDRTLPEKLNEVLHMTLGLHVWIAVQAIVMVTVSCIQHIHDGRRLHAFFDYFAGTSFVIYSYAGEKVPWVSIHIVLPMAMACGLYAAELTTLWSGSTRVSRNAGRISSPGRASNKRLAVMISVAGASFVWMAAISYALNFHHPGSPIERHTYASSHPEFHREMRAVIAEAEAGPGGYQTRIEFEGQVGWPLHWTLRRFTNQGHAIAPDTRAEFLISDKPRSKPGPDYIDHYDWTRVRFRHYWQPRPLDWRAMRRLDLLLRSEDKLTPEQARVRKRARAGWGKVWTALVLRDEDVQGEYRWDHLGGIDVYIGRRRTL